MAAPKEERLQMRVDPQRKQMLERAASASDQNISAFVLLAASQRAESVLAERPRTAAVISAEVGTASFD